MKNKIGFYPGCSLEGTAREYNESVMSMAALFDIELVSTPDWNCCGATAAHNLNKTLSLALPGRILALSAKAGLTELLAPCAACYNRLAVAQHELFENAELKKQVEEAIDMPLKQPIRILNVIQFIQEYIVEKLPAKQVKEIDKKVACYYGCLLVRPHEVLQFDRQEDPQTIDEVMKRLGAEPIDWPFKTECCGASLSVGRTDLAVKLSGRIVREAAERGAEAIIVACPMCHSNLDMRRSAINKLPGKPSDIPVLYLAQAIGMACGLDDKQTGVRRHLVRVDWKRLAEKKARQEQPIIEGED